MLNLIIYKDVGLIEEKLDYDNYYAIATNRDNIETERDPKLEITSH
jgi:hypothetical protein